ncbi:hypothetical protein [Shimia sp.]|uniref:hypothetical protein n=1 Tax=Shimia sp. TaxID=1954381 RepID=UPI0032971E12
MSRALRARLGAICAALAICLTASQSIAQDEEAFVRDQVLPQCAPDVTRAVLERTFTEVTTLPQFADSRADLRLKYHDHAPSYFPQIDRSGTIHVDAAFVQDSCYLTLASKIGQIGFGAPSRINKNKPSATVSHLATCRRPGTTWRTCLGRAHEAIQTDLQADCAERKCQRAEEGSRGFLEKTINNPETPEKTKAMFRNSAESILLTGPYFESHMAAMLRFFLIHEAVHFQDNHFAELDAGQIDLTTAELTSDLVAAVLEHSTGVINLFEMFTAYEDQQIPGAKPNTARTAFEASIAPPSLKNALIRSEHQQFACRSGIVLDIKRFQTLSQKDYVSHMAQGGSLYACSKHSGPALFAAYARAKTVLATSP